MPFATAPSLLIGLGARILLDTFSRTEAPAIKDYILVGAWQGVALHYAAKTSKNSGFGIIVAFAIAAKLFIEFNLVFDVTRCITTILGVALGVLFTDFLSQYFDKPPPTTTERRKKKATTTQKPERKHEKTVQFRPSVQGGSVETIAELTDVTGTFTTASHLFSDITSVDSSSEKFGPSSSMTALEREIHVLRTRASLADTERRRLKEERKWAISQGNEARAQQMKWEVKRYTSLMQTFNREADLKALEVANKNANGNGRRLTERDKPKVTTTSTGDKSQRSPRGTSLNGNSPQPLPVRLSGHKSTRQGLASNGKARDANG